MKSEEIIFTKERYSSYDVEKMLVDFGQKMVDYASERTPLSLSFTHKGMYSKKQDYIN